MDSSSLSSPAVSHTLHLPLLVLTAHRSDVYELTTVLSDRQSVLSAKFALELVHFPLLASEAEENLSFSDLSGLLKLIATGHFAALFVFLPCSTWSRARHSGSPGPKPLRSRQHPLGLPSLPPEHQHVLASHNQALVFAIMCAEIAQQFCPAVSIIWVAPEDLAGHVQTGPPSVWQIRETTQLQSRTSGVVRGVAYSCELGAADYTRPVGFLTNVPGLIRELRQGWPVFQHRGPVIRYRGPLPQSCACGSKHTSLEGVAASKALPLFQPAFWQFLLLQVSARYRSLRDGVKPSPVSGDLRTLNSYTSNPWVVSLASAPDSLRIEFEKLVSTMVQISSSSSSLRVPIAVPGVHHGTGVPLFTGSRPGAPLSSSPTFSSSTHSPLSPSPTHNSCSPLFGTRLRCGPFSQCLLKGPGSPWMGGFRSSLVPAVLVEKTRQSHRLKSEEVRNVVRQRCSVAAKVSRSGGQQMFFRSRVEVARVGALRGRGRASVKVSSIRRSVPPCPTPRHAVGRRSHFKSRATLPSWSEE